MEHLWLTIAGIASVGTAMAVVALGVAGVRTRMRQRQRPRSGPKIDLFGS